MKWLANILGHSDERRPVSIHIHIRTGGFDVVAQTEVPITIKVDWEYVKKIEASKFGEDGEEAVCLKFSRFWGRSEIVLYRGDSGFKDLSPVLGESFPGFPEDWEPRIDAPFGFPDREILYEAP